MRRDKVLQIIADHRAELHSLGVAALWLFGSVARDEAQPDSDVDVLVEVRGPMGLFGLARIKNRLEDLLDCAVDLGTRDGVRAELKDAVEAELVRAA